MASFFMHRIIIVLSFKKLLSVFITLSKNNSYICIVNTAQLIIKRLKQTMVRLLS